MATKTENTAVNRLIEMAGARPFEADDALFSSPPPARKTLPKPFPARISAPADPPAPLPRARTPHSTQTNLAAVQPAAAPAPTPPQEEISTRPFDQIELDPELLDSAEDEADDDLPITVTEEAALVRALAPAPVAPAPSAIPPLTIGPVEPLAARPSALGAIPGTDEANWFEESVGVDRVDEAALSLRGPASTSRYRTMLWLSAAFAAGLVATAVVAWPGRTGATKLSGAIAKQPAAPAVAPAPAVVTPAQPAVVPATDNAAAPAVVEPLPVEPAVVEPVPAEPAVVEPVPAEPALVEPAVPTEVTVHLDSEPSGATVLVVDSGTTVTLGVTPLDQPLDPSRLHEIMFTMSGHRSTLVTVDPSASQRVTVDLATSKAVAQPPAAAPEVARSEPVRKAAPRPAKAAKATRPTKAPRVATAPAPARTSGGGTLMLGAKPPCDIFIDGRATGLRTPQRAIKVAPGSHKITLVNREHRITETFSVSVKPGTPTKVVKDLTRRMK